MISLNQLMIDCNNRSNVQYARCIKLFANNFEPFMKYKDDDNIDWVVQEHSLLYDEIIKHGINNDLSQSTIRGYIIAMMHIIKIYYNTKNNDVYKKYQDIIENMKQNIIYNEYNNKLNKSELKKGGVIPFQLLLDKQKEIQEQFNQYLYDPNVNLKNNINAFHVNQDLLLISLYTLMPPVRNEIKELLFTHTFPDDDDDNNYIIILPNTIQFYYGCIKKKHSKLIINDNEIDKNLKEIILHSYILYTRKNVFCSTSKFPFYDIKQSIPNINHRLRTIFKDTKYIVGTSMIRSSYITYHFANLKLSYNEQLNIARLMRTSVEICRQYYYKIIDDDNNIIIPGINIKEKQSIYYQNNKDKIAEYNSNYYQKNKDELNDKNKEYRINNTYKENRRKLIYRLNNEPNYASKCRDITFTKYDIKINNGKYY